MVIMVGGTVTGRHGARAVEENLHPCAGWRQRETGPFADKAFIYEPMGSILIQTTTAGLCGAHIQSSHSTMTVWGSYTKLQSSHSIIYESYTLLNFSFTVF